MENKTPSAELTRYLLALRRQYRLLVSAKAAALIVWSAWGLTIAFAMLLLWLPFPHTLRWSRRVLGGALAAEAAIVLALCWRRYSANAVIMVAERKWPAFDNRLATFAGRKAPCNPFFELLASDTLSIARGAGAAGLISTRQLVIWGVTVLAAGLGLAFILASGGGELASNAKALWMLRNPFRVTAEGDRARVLRDEGLQVTVKTVGFYAREASLEVRFAKSRRSLKLVRAAEELESTFVIPVDDIVEDGEFWAQVDGVRSAVGKVRAVDVPMESNFERSGRGGYRKSGAVETPAGTRSAPREWVPEGYERAVEEYHRLLNQRKPGR